MGPPFTIAEVVQATGARWLPGGPPPPPSFQGVFTDTRVPSAGSLFVALVGERFDAHDFLPQALQAGAAALVVQAGRPVPPGASAFVVPDTLVALGALGRFHRRRFSFPLAAVTGSNGKTTTKELIAAVLATRGPVLKTKGNLNNEVGVPLTLLGLGAEHVAAVVELGMNHPGEIDRMARMAEPTCGLITVVQPAHVEGCGSLEGVARAKGELFRALPPGATAVVNLDDERVRGQAQGLAVRTLTFGRDAAAQVRLARVDDLGPRGLQLEVAFEGRRVPVALPLLGVHNAGNAAGAFAVGLALGYSPDECARGLSQVSQVGQRLQQLALPSGATLVDDSYNANPGSMEAGLHTLAALARASGGRALAVLGDMLEQGALEDEVHQALGRQAAAHTVATAFFGPRTRQSARAAREAGLSRVEHFEDVGALAAWVGQGLGPGDVVLVKGSRGMKLERVVALLAGRAAPEGH